MPSDAQGQDFLIDQHIGGADDQLLVISDDEVQQAKNDAQQANDESDSETSKDSEGHKKPSVSRVLNWIWKSAQCQQELMDSKVDEDTNENIQVPDTAQNETIQAPVDEDEKTETESYDAEGVDLMAYLEGGEDFDLNAETESANDLEEYESTQSESGVYIDENDVSDID